MTRVVFEGPRAVGVERRRRDDPRRRGDPLRRRDQLAAAAPALRRRQRAGARRARHRRRPRPARRRREPPGPPRGLRAVLLEAARLGRAGAEVAKPAAGRLKWLFLRSGPGATNHFEAGGFIRSNDDVAYPNLMFHFLPVAIRYDGSQPAGGHGYQVHVGPMYSDARGSVKITSTDPRVHPALRFNYLSTDQDRREWVEAIRVRARRSSASPRSTPFNGGEISPGPAVETDEEILDWVAATPRPRCIRRARARWAPTSCPSSTRRRCACTGSTACASSTPRCSRYVTNGNIYAPVMMVAEKAADLDPRQHAAPARSRRLLPHAHDARALPVGEVLARSASGRPRLRAASATALTAALAAALVELAARFSGDEESVARARELACAPRSSSPTRTPGPTPTSCARAPRRTAPRRSTSRSPSQRPRTRRPRWRSGWPSRQSERRRRRARGRRARRATARAASRLVELNRGDGSRL